jgi:hypothetical protein
VEAAVHIQPAASAQALGGSPAADHVAVDGLLAIDAADLFDCCVSEFCFA